jgi:gas vesicle protein
MVDDEFEPDDDDVDQDEGGEEYVEEGKSRTVSFISGLVLGALLGAGIALLVAPERGVVTRKRLRRFAHRFREDATERLEDIRDAVGKELARKRKKIRQQLEERV